MKSELDLIKYLEKIKTFDKKIIKGIGDDCAIVKFDTKKVCNNIRYIVTWPSLYKGLHT